MKKLTKLAFVCSVAFGLYAQNEDDNFKALKEECFQGKTEACSIIIDNDPELAALRQELLEKEWTDEERLGIALRVHYLAYERERDSENKDEDSNRKKEKNGEKFVKHVMRVQMYNK